MAKHNKAAPATATPETPVTDTNAETSMTATDTDNAATAASMQATHGPESKMPRNPKARAAEHSLIDAEGNEVDDMELATGIRYVHLASGQTLDHQVRQGSAGTALTMLAVFGAKTLATNEASQVRQANGKQPSAEELTAIKDRFRLIDGGQWVDRTGGGSRGVDLDKLAQAVIDTTGHDGIVTGKDGKQYNLAAMRARLEPKDEFFAVVRKVPKITDRYNELLGRTTKTVDELFGAL